VFTGLVQEVGTVTALEPGEGSAEIEVEAPLAVELSEGDSVLVSGVCLTARALAGSRFRADLSSETLARSSLGALAAGDRVNLELPLRAADRLGGHIVQGHVDALGEIADARDDGAGRELWIEAPAELLRYVVEKGSIAVDGVSLTVTAVDDRGFGVSLIPETLERTNLHEAARGRRVNLEVDVLAKYVEKLAAPRNGVNA
jgi:riboflavin synthase